MSDITVSLEDDAIEVLEKRAKKNFLTLKEQIEDIIRKSAIRYKSSSSTSTDSNIDDNLVSIFSRSRRGRKKKKN